jgi:thiol-disulfide isomerase/thioredoxin
MVVGQSRMTPSLRAARWLLAGLVLQLAWPVMAESVDFTLPGLDGERYRLSDYRGKWVVVNYWATWCPPCLEELPELESFHSRHQDRDALVLGVNLERIEADRLREFVSLHKISYPILLQSPGEDTELGRVLGLPTTYLISPQGELLSRQVGRVTAKTLETYLEQHR